MTWETEIINGTAAPDRGGLRTIEVATALAEAGRAKPGVDACALEAALEVQVLAQGGRRLGAYFILPGEDIDIWAAA